MDRRVDVDVDDPKCAVERKGQTGVDVDGEGQRGHRAGAAGFLQKKKGERERERERERKSMGRRINCKALRFDIGLLFPRLIGPRLHSPFLLFFTYRAVLVSVHRDRIRVERACQCSEQTTRKHVQSRKRSAEDDLGLIEAGGEVDLAWDRTEEQGRESGQCYRRQCRRPSLSLRGGRDGWMDE